MEGIHFTGYRESKNVIWLYRQGKEPLFECWPGDDQLVCPGQEEGIDVGQNVMNPQNDMRILAGLDPADQLRLKLFSIACRKLNDAYIAAFDSRECPIEAFPGLHQRGGFHQTR